MKYVRALYNKKLICGFMKGSKIEVYSDLPWNNGVSTFSFIDSVECKLLSPVVPGKVVCVAINYPGATGINEEIDEPLVFIKSTNTIIGNHDTIISPFKNYKVWGEPELGIVISKQLKNAKIEDVKNSIFGYTIVNDVTVENIGGRDHHLARSKSVDTFCVVGPHIDTEFIPSDKKITGLHNDVLLRSGLLSDRISKEPDLLVSISKWMTLEPGDLIITGSPTRIREREYLKDGDSFECNIEGLGKIKNRFKNI